MGALCWNCGYRGDRGGRGCHLAAGSPGRHNFREAESLQDRRWLGKVKVPWGHRAGVTTPYRTCSFPTIHFKLQSGKAVSLFCFHVSSFVAALIFLVAFSI